MADLGDRVEKLETRVGRLQNLAWVLGAIAAFLGLGGASLWSQLGEMRTEAGKLREQVSAYRTDVGEARKNLESAVATALTPRRDEALERVAAREKQAVSAVDAASQRTIVTAGSIGLNGTVVRRSGKSFRVSQPQPGRYRITFDEALPTAPIPFAISDGGRLGAFAEITTVDSKGFVVEGHTYGTHALAAIGFQFLVTQAGR